MDKVLVVVDVQKNFIEQCRAEEIVPRVADKILQRKAEGYEIIFTLDKSGGERPALVENASSGAGIYHKNSYGCKRLILDLAKKRPSLIEFSGVCTDICVIANVLGVLSFLPFSTIVVDKNCCASSANGHAAALRVMEACGVHII